MSRIRTVKPGLFKNEDLAELPAMARLLFIGLFCIADRAGRLEDRPKRIKAELFPYDNADVNDLLSRLQSAGFIYRYEVGEMKVIQVINFTKHQRITGTEALTESEWPEYNGKQLGNTLETTSKQLGRLEGKGKEGKGEEEGNAPEGFIWDVEKEIVSNQIRLEKICMTPKLKPLEFVLESLHKYHLWLQKETKYPIARKAAYPGFELWLTNEKQPLSNGNKHESDIQKARDEYERKRLQNQPS